jgi:hypothetical protein
MEKPQLRNTISIRLSCSFILHLCIVSLSRSSSMYINHNHSGASSSTRAGEDANPWCTEGC